MVFSILRHSISLSLRDAEEMLPPQLGRRAKQAAPKKSPSKKKRKTTLTRLDLRYHKGEVKETNRIEMQAV